MCLWRLQKRRSRADDEMRLYGTGHCGQKETFCCPSFRPKSPLPNNGIQYTVGSVSLGLHIWLAHGKSLNLRLDEKIVSRNLGSSPDVCPIVSEFVHIHMLMIERKSKFRHSNEKPRLQLSLNLLSSLSASFLFCLFSSLLLSYLTLRTLFISSHFFCLFSLSTLSPFLSATPFIIFHLLFTITPNFVLTILYRIKLLQNNTCMTRYSLKIMRTNLYSLWLQIMPI